MLARTAGESKDPIAKFLKDSEHFFFRPVYRAMIKIMIAARSDRACARILNPVVLDALQTLKGIWIDTLGAAATCSSFAILPRGKASFSFRCSRRVRCLFRHAGLHFGYSTNSLVKRSSTGCADWEIPCLT